MSALLRLPLDLLRLPLEIASGVRLGWSYTRPVDRHVTVERTSEVSA
jgi:hypothetical protein